MELGWGEEGLAFSGFQNEEGGTDVRGAQRRRQVKW
jgi:hypothetical protein